MEHNMEPRELVLKYLGHLNNHEYGEASRCLASSVVAVGPSGEAFRDRESFIGMMKTHQSRYDLKKTFSDGPDVCVLYDFVFESGRVYASSWYQVKDGSIHTITTVFDPARMPGPP